MSVGEQHSIEDLERRQAAEREILATLVEREWYLNPVADWDWRRTST